MQRKIFTIMTLLLFSAYPGFSQSDVITVSPNTSIKVESGTDLVISGNLVLKSDASGDASLIDYGNVTYNSGGMAKVERYLTQGKWHLISSPVSSMTAGLFTGDYLQSHSESTNGWTDIASATYPLAAMQGYALWSVATVPTTVVFSGTTNTGSKSIAFTKGGPGFNLVGNPYPSTLDWDKVTIPSTLGGAIWIFDPTVGSNGDYLYYLKGASSGNTASQYIASGQGFFVQATGSGNLSFDNTDRVHQSGLLFKNAVVNKMLVLKVTGNSITTQTAIRFNTNATQGVDRLYDVSLMMTNSPEVPVLFTKSGGSKMSINTLPAIKGNKTVPMWFRAGTDGEYSIKVSGMATFSSQTPLFLEDLQTGIVRNLRETPEYTFDYLSGSDYSFLLLFDKTLNIETKQERHIQIYAYGKVLNVNFPTGKLTNPNFNARIMVFDLAGRKILQESTREMKNRIPLPANNTLYIVKVITGRKTATGKVFIK